MQLVLGAHTQLQGIGKGDEPLYRAETEEIVLANGRSEWAVDVPRMSQGLTNVNGDRAFGKIEVRSDLDSLVSFPPPI